MIEIKNANRQVSSIHLERMQRAWDQLFQRKDLGFFQLPDRDSLWSEVDRVSQVLQSDFEQFVFIGIGGSGLGGRTIEQVFRDPSRSQRIRFLENVDVTSVGAVFAQIDVQKTAWILTSKSGTTLETLALTNEVGRRLEELGLSFQDRLTVITEDKDNPLRKLGQRYGAHFLEIPEDVGGRFSVLTAVGLLPASLMGAELQAFQKAAQWANGQKSLVCELGAQALASFERDESITQFGFTQISSIFWGTGFSSFGLNRSRKARHEEEG